MFLDALVTGFSSFLVLIVAIGAQNSFMLRQGLLCQHVLPIALFFGFCDALLLGAGVLGFGALVRAVPWLPPLMLWFGVLFLIGYGFTRLWAAYRGSSVLVAGASSRTSLRDVLVLAAIFTWLNPHAYLDTLVIMGALSLSFPSGIAKTAFLLGATAASLVFFLALGYGARFLTPFFTSVRAWRILDTGIALIMFALAAKLALSSPSF